MRRIAIVLVLTLFVISFAPHVLAQDDSPETSYLRFAHFAAGADAVDVYMDGEPVDLFAQSSSMAMQSGNDEGSTTSAGEMAAEFDFGAIGDWMAVEPGSHQISIAPAGTSADQAVVGPIDVSVNAGEWTTFAVTGSGETLMATPVIEDQAEMPPGVAHVTFFNGLSADTTVNFNRDGVPFASQVGAAGNGQGLASSSNLSIDYGTYTFSANATDDESSSFGELADTKISESNHYLIGVVDGADGPELVIHETLRASVLLVRGDLEAPGTVFEAASSNEHLTSFFDLLSQAGLEETLRDSGPYTVFAPADFVADDVMRQFANDPDGLANYLRGYIVEGDYKFNDLLEAGILTAMNGEDLSLALDGETVSMNGAQILTPNIAAINGTIHMIGQAAAQG